MTKSTFAFTSVALSLCCTVLQYAPATAQTLPSGCWQIEQQDGASKNYLYQCQGNALCGQIIAPTVNGTRPNQQDVGKCIIQSATKNGQSWNGEILIVSDLLEQRVNMTLQVVDNNHVDVTGSFGPISETRRWTKITCPTNNIQKTCSH